ncbi:MAG: hypothetical protein AAFO99_06555 [Bacteroidota bacterium]
MSIGNPKKFKIVEKLRESKLKNELSETPLDDISRVHKDKNHRVKKELSFTKNNKSKLA